MTMTDVVVTNPSEIRELTIDELDKAGGGERPPPDPKLVDPAFSTFSVSSSTNSCLGY